MGGAFMAISECPLCTFHIPIDSSMAEGDVVQCPDCGASLKLASITPPLFEMLKED